MIGRKKEIEELLRAYEIPQSEFVAVYGRRRVGKTFMIRETFNSKFVFEHSGVARSGTRIQLDRFRDSLERSGAQGCSVLKSWFDAFDRLRDVIAASTVAKKVVFIDEMPWMDKPNANFVPALENFWNAWASARKDVLLIVCGSATSWMLKKVIHSKGGLHNRVTSRIPLRPFTLAECEELAHSLGLEASRYQLVQYYMALGGIPFYWNHLRRGLSVAQNMDEMFFSGTDKLENEFEELYSSLFARKAPYVKLVTLLGKKKMGMTREELSKGSGIGNSGTLTKYLTELEQCGFVRRYRLNGKSVRDSLYQVIDNLTLFHFKFVRENLDRDPKFWSSSVDSRMMTTWQGLAFELVCLQHVEEIKRALQIAGVHSQNYAWRCVRPDIAGAKGAQVDLVIDRKDGVVNLCEIKFASRPYVINEQEYFAVQNKKAAFRREADERKSLHVVYITTFGVEKNSYSDVCQAQVAMDALFDS